MGGVLRPIRLARLQHRHLQTSGDVVTAASELRRVFKKSDSMYQLHPKLHPVAEHRKEFKEELIELLCQRVGRLAPRIAKFDAEVREVMQLKTSAASTASNLLLQATVLLLTIATLVLGAAALRGDDERESGQSSGTAQSKLSRTSAQDTDSKPVANSTSRLAEASRGRNR